jgi:peptidoglycan/LPS O-acetylase OafA/YrhL
MEVDRIATRPETANLSASAGSEQEQVLELDALKIPRRRDIDALRGIAVMAVVGFHFFPDLVPGGFVGVDVFFVISGYVITNILVRRQPTTIRALANFWGHRVRRLFPALGVTLFATLIVGWFVMWPAQFMRLGQSVAWSAAMLGNVFAWRDTSYFTAELTSNPLLNLWSLGVEEQFYLVWPLLVAALFLAVRNRLGPAAIALVLLTVASWTAALLTVRASDNLEEALSAVFYLPWFRAWELSIGGLVAIGLLARSRRRPNAGPLPRQTWPYALAVAALAVSLVIAHSDSNPALYALGTVLLTALVIAMGEGRAFAERRVGNQPLLWLGKISYPLYLWHWPLMALAVTTGVMLGAASGVLLVGASVALAYLTWRFIEMPIQQLRVSGRLVLAIVAAVGAVAVLGVVVITSAGFPDRGWVTAQHLNRFTYQYPTAYRMDSCFLEPDRGFPTALLTQCVDSVPGQRNMLLWGDSFAAALYPGLKAVAGTQSSLSQLTVAGCKPALPDRSPAGNCRDMNDIAINAINAIKRGAFDTIVLSGVWSGDDAPGLEALIDGITSISDANVVVVGPYPQWSPSLPRVWTILEGQDMDKLPRYTSQGLRAEPAEVSALLSKAVERAGATYFDAIDALCNVDGCLIRTGDDATTITAWDYGHLTTEGSMVLASKLAPILRVAQSSPADSVLPPS